MNHDLRLRLDNGTPAVRICEIKVGKIERRELMAPQRLSQVRPKLSLGAGDYDPHAVPFCNRFAYRC